MPIWFDHLFAALLLVIWPLWVARNGREDMRKLGEDPDGPLGTYRTTAAFQWAHALLIIGLWWFMGRGWSELGLGLEIGWGFAAAAVLSAAALRLMWRQSQRVRNDPIYAAKIREQAQDALPLLPRTPREMRAIRTLAVTAGICEELCYRGFLLWYMGCYVHPVLAIAAMAIAFGGGHLYQGVQAAAQIAVIGTIAALLFLLAGSLWIPMVLHTLFDWHQIAMVRTCFENTPQGVVTPSSA